MLHIHMHISQQLFITDKVFFLMTFTPFLLFLLFLCVMYELDYGYTIYPTFEIVNNFLYHFLNKKALANVDLLW